MNALERVLRFTVAACFLVTASATAADDLKISQLEQEVRELQRLVQQQSRRIDALENSVRQARVNVVPLPERTPASAQAATQSKAGQSSAGQSGSIQPNVWLDAANWDRLKIGMTEADVMRLLGAPTTTRSIPPGDVQTLFYAMELEAGGYLSGRVVTREQRVLEIHRPTLK
jgi:hypothetical protein